MYLPKSFDLTYDIIQYKLQLYFKFDDDIDSLICHILIVDINGRD